MKDFTPPFPAPNKSKTSYIKRFFKSRNSWIHTLFEKSYSMKLGHVRLPGLNVFIPVENSLVKRVLVDEWKDFPKHHGIEKALKPLLGEGILTNNGEKWRKQRAMIDPAFAHTRLEKAFPLMNAAVDDMLARLKAHDETKPLHVDLEMTHVTADIIFRTILSHTLSATEAEEVFSAFHDFQESIQRAMVLNTYKLPSFRDKKAGEKAAARIRAVFATIIKKRYDAYVAGTDTENRDILSALMIARDAETGEAFTYEELVDHVSVLFLGGHETAASSLTWGMYLIASCPDIQNQMRTEIEEATAVQPINNDHLKKLKFTIDVFAETLRLYPPIGFFLRESTKDCTMRGKQIKKGAMVLVAPWLIHRNKDQWKDAEKFCPFRFKDKESESSIKNSYIPFGAGPRICIGKGFANQEAILILANLVKNFEFTVTPGHVPEPIGRVTIRPKNGVMLQIKKL